MAAAAAWKPLWLAEPVRWSANYKGLAVLISAPPPFNTNTSIIVEIKSWMAVNVLCLNDKTEILLLGSKSFLNKVNSIFLQIGSHTVQCTTHARNIGTNMDNTMNTITLVKLLVFFLETLEWLKSTYVKKHVKDSFMVSLHPDLISWHVFYPEHQRLF